MEKPSSYCQAILTMDKNNVHRIYHDEFYGFPIEDDNELFERLILEINQAGLSWDTILKKQQNFKKAYKDFNIKKVATFKEKDFERLMNDAGIIRNRLKIMQPLRMPKRFYKFKRNSVPLRIGWIIIIQKQKKNG